jgi:hypothetical protein
VTKVGNITKGTVVAASTSTTTAAVRVLVEDMVLMLLNRLGRKEVGKLMASRMFICPLLHRPEHVTLDLNVLVAGGRMVECPKHIIADLIDGNTGVLPGIENTPMVS